MWESSVLYKNASVLVKEAAKIARVYGDDRGVIYINNLFKPYLYDERIFNTLTRQTGTVTVGSVLDGSTVVVGSGGSSTY